MINQWTDSKQCWDLQICKLKEKIQRQKNLKRKFQLRDLGYLDGNHTEVQRDSRSSKLRQHCSLLEERVSTRTIFYDSLFYFENWQNLIFCRETYGMQTQAKTRLNPHSLRFNRLPSISPPLPPSQPFPRWITSLSIDSRLRFLPRFSPAFFHHSIFFMVYQPFCLLVVTNPTTCDLSFPPSVSLYLSQYEREFQNPKFATVGVLLSFQHFSWGPHHTQEWHISRDESLRYDTKHSLNSQEAKKSRIHLLFELHPVYIISSQWGRHKAEEVKAVRPERER